MKRNEPIRKSTNEEHQSHSAIRLPNNCFDYAGTTVGSDLYHFTEEPKTSPKQKSYFLPKHYITHDGTPGNALFRWVLTEFGKHTERKWVPILWTGGSLIYTHQKE